MARVLWHDGWEHQRATIERLQGKGRKHHISLPSIVVHHGPHPSHLRVDVPLLPLQTELLGPVSLPWPSLSVPNCPSAHLTMGIIFPLLHPCTLRALKAKIYSALLSQTASGPLPHPFLRTQCDHQPCTWGGLSTTFPLPPVFPLPFLGGRGEKRSQAIFRGTSARGGGMWHQKASWIDLTWGSAWAFCRVLKGSFVLFWDHTFFCVP